MSIFNACFLLPLAVAFAHHQQGSRDLDRPPIRTSTAADKVWLDGLVKQLHSDQLLYHSESQDPRHRRQSDTYYWYAFQIANACAVLSNKSMLFDRPIPAEPHFQTSSPQPTLEARKEFKRDAKKLRFAVLLLAPELDELGADPAKLLSNLARLQVSTLNDPPKTHKP